MSEGRQVGFWGGEHGDEIRSIETARALMERSRKNVIAGLANLRACEQGTRYIKMNMTYVKTAFPFALPYDRRRAYQVRRLSKGNWGTLNHHTGEDSGPNCAVVGRYGVRPEMLGFLAELGLYDIVLSTKPGVHGMTQYIENCT